MKTKIFSAWVGGWMCSFTLTSVLNGRPGWVPLLFAGLVLTVMGALVPARRADAGGEG